MDFADKIKAHTALVAERMNLSATEEAAKMSLVAPFLKMLGYDPFDPRAVIPEYTAAFGEKKNARVDYAVLRDGEVIMVIEVKKVGDCLDVNRETQLQMYFQNTPARIAILTDGVVYKFYTDLDAQNLMDKIPFMTLDFTRIEPALVEELKKLCNDCFDAEVALCAAQELKYLGELKKIIAKEMKDPQDELVKYFARQFYTRNINQKMLDTFRTHVITAFSHNINDILNQRLQGAMQSNDYPVKGAGETATEEACGCEAESRESRIVTTAEETEGYMIAKAILREIVDVERIAMRDTISYCGVLLDDKNNKPICRLHLNSATTRYLETFELAPDGKEKIGTKHKIETLDDIFQYADQLKAIVKAYDERDKQ